MCSWENTIYFSCKSPSWSQSLYGYIVLSHLLNFNILRIWQLHAGFTTLAREGIIEEFPSLSSSVGQKIQNHESRYHQIQEQLFLCCYQTTEGSASTEVWSQSTNLPHCGTCQYILHFVFFHLHYLFYLRMTWMYSCIVWFHRAAHKQTFSLDLGTCDYNKPIPKTLLVISGHVWISSYHSISYLQLFRRELVNFRIHLVGSVQSIL